MQNNKFRKSFPTWNEKCELFNRSYSVSDAQYYFQYIIKNMKFQN